MGKNLLFVYGIDTPLRLSKQIGEKIDVAFVKKGTLNNRKIGRFGFNPLTNMGFQTLIKQEKEQVQGLVIQNLSSSQLAKLDGWKSMYERKVKLVHVDGEESRKRCFVYIAK